MEIEISLINVVWYRNTINILLIFVTPTVAASSITTDCGTNTTTGTTSKATTAISTNTITLITTIITKISKLIKTIIIIMISNQSFAMWYVFKFRYYIMYIYNLCISRLIHIRICYTAKS